MSVFVRDGDDVLLSSAGDVYRYVGAIECPRCIIWRPAFEDAAEVDTATGVITGWSGVGAADCDDCEVTLILGLHGETCIVEWAEAS